MVRRIAIVLAAAAAVVAGSTLVASARGGMGHGGMGHFGGMGGGGFGRMGGVGPTGFGRSGFGRPGFASPGGVGRFAAGRPVVLHGNRFAFRHHRLFRHRVAFVGVPYFYDDPYAYAYYDSCYRRVWTRWGWRYANVCY
jgi:hypothetical protein